jgi:hypothetical protein
MTTFNNGESLSSVRTKINEAIDKVDGNSAFDNDIDVNGNVSLGDNDELRFGDSNDLIIEHTGALTDIRSATGHMSIRNFADDRDVSIQSDDGSGGTTNYFVADGSTGEAKLYYYGSEKLNTQSGGVDITGTLDVTGNISLGDNDELRFGDSDDLIIEHNGTFGDIFNKTSVLAIRNGADNQDVVIQTDDGSGSVADYFRAEGSTGEAKMYYYGSEKLNTKSTGVDVTGDLTVDTTTLHVDSTNNRIGIGLTNPGSELHIKGSTPQVRLQPTGDTQNNRIEFCNAAGVIQSRIMSGGSNGDQIQLDGNVEVLAGHNLSLPDNVELRFGDSNDLILEHNGSNGDIRNSTNDLLIRNLANDRDVIIQSDDGSGGTVEYVRMDGSNGQVKLFHYGGLRLNTTSSGVDVTGALDVSGALSKASGSFKIDHPLKPETHHLVHSFVEAPQADNIYRGKVSLVAGAATVNLDEAGRMTEGTFVALNGNIQCFTSNEDGWTAVRGSVSGNTLTIQAQDTSCTDTVSWLVIGERHDSHMLDTDWTDAAGRVITEPEKQAEEEE